MGLGYTYFTICIFTIAPIKICLHLRVKPNAQNESVSVIRKPLLNSIDQVEKGVRAKAAGKTVCLSFLFPRLCI